MLIAKLQRIPRLRTKNAFHRLLFFLPVHKSAVLSHTSRNWQKFLFLGRKSLSPVELLIEENLWTSGVVGAVAHMCLLDGKFTFNGNHNQTCTVEPNAISQRKKKYKHVQCFINRHIAHLHKKVARYIPFQQTPPRIQRACSTTLCLRSTFRAQKNEISFLRFLRKHRNSEEVQPVHNSQGPVKTLALG